jgi:hypothetical protein
MFILVSGALCQDKEFSVRRKTMKRAIVNSFGLGALLLGVVQTPAMGVTIDLFNDVNDLEDGFQTVFDSSTTSTPVREDTDTSLSDVLGGQRYIKVETYQKAGGGSQVGGLLEVDPVLTIVGFSTGTNVKAHATLRWDGGGSLNQDLTLGGHNSFRLEVSTIDQYVTLNFKVDDTSTNSGIISKTINAPGTYYFPYSEASGVDFTSAKSIELYTSAEPTELDFTFDFAQTDIDPATVPFEFSPTLGIILCGGFFAMKNSRKKDFSKN